jgi:hypothetical protein
MTSKRSCAAGTPTNANVAPRRSSTTTSTPTTAASSRTPAASDALSDRGADPQLRGYLWASPAGIDWFVHLADHNNADLNRRILQAAYRDPLTPTELATLWPEGPTIGGPQPNSTAAQRAN